MEWNSSIQNLKLHHVENLESRISRPNSLRYLHFVHSYDWYEHIELPLETKSVTK